MLKKLSIGEKLKQVRNHNELSQKDFAKSIGIKPPYLSELENNKKEITSKLLIAVSENFPVSIDWLLFNDISYSESVHSKHNEFSTPRSKGNTPNDLLSDKYCISLNDIDERINTIYHRMNHLYQRIVDITLIYSRLKHGEGNEEVEFRGFMDGLGAIKEKYLNDMMGLGDDTIKALPHLEIENLAKMKSPEKYKNVYTYDFEPELHDRLRNRDK